jgi:hypothetical protein
MSNQFEAKAYKRLYELYRSTLLAIINKARISAEHDAPDSMKITMSYIGNEHKWDQCGIEDKATSKIIDELEKCLSNEA